MLNAEYNNKDINRIDAKIEWNMKSHKKKLEKRFYCKNWSMKNTYSTSSENNTALSNECIMLDFIFWTFMQNFTLNREHSILLVNNILKHTECIFTLESQLLIHK